jgi:hypothetical protein
MILLAGIGAVYDSVGNKPPESGTVQSAVTSIQAPSGSAIEALGKLAVKGRAPKTGYERKKFSDGWGEVPGCNVRNFILKRDMTGVITRSETDCTVVQGTLQDPYTTKTIMFVNGTDTSDDVQIDHVVALSNSWQTGAQQLTAELRYTLANDPLNLLAVDGPTNQKKGDADAATWLPPNKDYRCRYVARQVAVKQKYTLWVTQAEHDAIAKILEACPEQMLPVVSPV